MPMTRWRAADDMAFEIRLMQDQNDQIFRQLEEAMTVSVEPLDKMFRSAGLQHRHRSSTRCAAAIPAREVR